MNLAVLITSLKCKVQRTNVPLMYFRYTIDVVFLSSSPELLDHFSKKSAIK